MSEVLLVAMSQIGQLYGMKNKAAIVLRCKLNDKQINNLMVLALSQSYTKIERFSCFEVSGFCVTLPE